MLYPWGKGKGRGGRREGGKGWGKKGQGEERAFPWFWICAISNIGMLVVFQILLGWAKRGKIKDRSGNRLEI